MPQFPLSINQTRGEIWGFRLEIQASKTQKSQIFVAGRTEPRKSPFIARRFKPCKLHTAFCRAKRHLPAIPAPHPCPCHEFLSFARSKAPVSLSSCSHRFLTTARFVALLTITQSCGNHVCVGRMDSQEAPWPFLLLWSH